MTNCPCINPVADPIGFAANILANGFTFNTGSNSDTSSDKDISDVPHVYGNGKYTNVVVLKTPTGKFISVYVDTNIPLTKTIYSINYENLDDSITLDGKKYYLVLGGRGTSSTSTTNENNNGGSDGTTIPLRDVFDDSNTDENNEIGPNGDKTSSISENDEGESDVDGSIFTTSERVDILKERGFNYYSNGEYNLAIDCYEDALKIDPKNGEVLYNMGLAYRFLGYNILADEYFKDAAQLGYCEVD